MKAETRSLLATAAAIVLGVAMYSDLQWVSVALLVPSMVLAAIAALGDERWELEQDPNTLANILYRGAFVVGVLLTAASLADALELDTAAHVALLVCGITAVGASAYAVIWLHKGRVAFALFIAAFLLTTIGMVIASRGHGYNDVVTFQEDSAQALADGKNPYAIRFPDEYGERSKYFYGPGVSVDGVLQFGYPYLPLSLLVTAPFELIFDDFRLAHGLALIAAAYVMSRIRPGDRSRSLAVLFLLVSPVFNIVRFGWIEPLLILAASLVAYAAAHRKRATPYLAGAMLALKQYGVLMAPASLLLLERPFTVRKVVRHYLKMALVVAVTTLPFFLMNPSEFMYPVVELQFVQPFRPDSISLLAAWAAIAGEPRLILSSLLVLVVVGLATWATLKRTPTGPQGFALAAALTLLVAFSFSKQAFMNYYILVMGLLFIGAIARPSKDAGTDDESRSLVDAATSS